MPQPTYGEIVYFKNLFDETYDNGLQKLRAAPSFFPQFQKYSQFVMRNREITFLDQNHSIPALVCQQQCGRERRIHTRRKGTGMDQSRFRLMNRVVQRHAAGSLSPPIGMAWIFTSSGMELAASMAS
jgi:hypothetical protein